MTPKVSTTNQIHIRVLSMFKVLLGAATYFGIVFFVGFVLGTVRTLVLLPRIGERWAELCELPLMFMVMLVASWRLFSKSSFSIAQRLQVGVFALLLMLSAEFFLVLNLRQITISDYLSQRDPVAGTGYACMLIVFALLPVVFSRRKKVLKLDRSSHRGNSHETIFKKNVAPLGRCGPTCLVRLRFDMIC